MTDKKTENSSLEFVLAIILLFGVLLYKFIEQTGMATIQQAFVQVLEWLLAVVAISGLAWFLIARYRKHRARMQKECEHREWEIVEQLESMRNSENQSIEEIHKARRELDILEQEELTKYQLELVVLARKALQAKEHRIERELEADRAFWERKRAKKPFVDKLADHFTRKESTDSIPSWAIRLDSDILKDAKQEYDNRRETARMEKRKQDHEKTIWENAVEFVATNKEYPSDYSHLSEEEQTVYRKAVRMLNEGTLPRPQIEREERIIPEHLLNSRFYHADKLSEEQKKQLFAEGYRFIPFISLDGKTGNNLIIFNNKKRESDYHYCLKQLFGELHPDARVEYPVRDLRVDVAYKFGKKKIAVEIETGKNKRQLIKQKVPVLNAHFDAWIFVCGRDNKKRYKSFVDKKTSFCLTVKEAREKLRALAALEGVFLQ